MNSAVPVMEFQSCPQKFFFHIFLSAFFDSKKKLCALYGKWTECLYSVDPATFEAYKKNDKKNTEEKKSSKQVLIMLRVEISKA